MRTPKRLGRPLKTRKRQFLVTDRDYEKIQQAAKLRQMPIRAYIRYALLQQTERILHSHAAKKLKELKEKVETKEDIFANSLRGELDIPDQEDAPQS